MARRRRRRGALLDRVGGGGLLGSLLGSDGFDDLLDGLGGGGLLDRFGGLDLLHDLGLEPLNLVMKLVSCNGNPVAKISDAPGKTLCDDDTFLAYLCQVFNMDVPR